MENLKEQLMTQMCNAIDGIRQSYESGEISQDEMLAQITATTEAYTNRFRDVLTTPTVDEPTRMERLKRLAAARAKEAQEFIGRNTQTAGSFIQNNWKTIAAGAGVVLAGAGAVAYYLFTQDGNDASTKA